jgi:hypothetical protein
MKQPQSVKTSLLNPTVYDNSLNFTTALGVKGINHLHSCVPQTSAESVHCFEQSTFMLTAHFSVFASPRTGYLMWKGYNRGTSRY